MNNVETETAILKKKNSLDKNLSLDKLTTVAQLVRM